MYLRHLLVVLLLPAWSAIAFGQDAKLGDPSDITFTAKIDNTPQQYVLMLPKGFEPEKKHHVLMVLHGHGADRWQFVSAARDECRATRDVAAKYGMIYVSPEYRPTTSWMGPKAEADVVQIIAELRVKYKIEKFFIAGASMGGSSALTFAALHPDLIDGVCGMNGTANHLEYRNFQDAIAASFGGGKDRIPLEYKKRSAEYWPENFTMPVGVTVGGKDTSVPPQSVLRLADVLQQMKRSVLLIHRKDGGHSTTYADAVIALEYVIFTALGLEYHLPKDEAVKATPTTP